MLSYASVEADGAVLDRSAIDSAAMRLARDYRDGLLTDDFALLSRIAHNPSNVGGDVNITRLIEFGALLEYNTGSWRQPHPVVTLLPGYRQAHLGKSGPGGSAT
jgi:hypothetical protein